MDGINQFSVKKIISGVILLLLLISLPAIYYLVTQTQIFKPKASAYDIGIVPKSGVSIIQENGQPVIQTTSPDEFKITITSPIDTSRPGSDAGSILDNLKLVKETYASENLVGTSCGSSDLQDVNSLNKNYVYENGKNKGYCGVWSQKCDQISLLGGSSVATCFDRFVRQDVYLAGRVCTPDGQLTYIYQGGSTSSSPCVRDEVCKTLLGKNNFTKEGKDRGYRFDATCIKKQDEIPSTPKSGDSSPQSPSPAADPTVRYGCEGNAIIARSYRGNVLTSTEKTECDSNETCQIVQNDFGVVTSALCSQNTPGVTPPVVQQECDLPDGGSGVCSKAPNGELKPLDPTISPRREAGAVPVCGKQCVYSQGDSCYSGNCKDRSQNCGFNDNCGYSPSCSSGAVVACPASVSSPTGSAAGTTGGQTGTSAGGSAVIVDEFADHSLDGKRSAYTCAEGPLDAEKPEGSYAWKADCSRKCMYNNEKGPEDPAGCPKNTTDQYVNSDTSNWCYGFKDGNRCMQLKWTGAPAVRSNPTSPAPATSASPSPARSVPPSTAPASPAPAQPSSPAPSPSGQQPVDANRKTTHYRVTTDSSRPGTWNVYTAGGVNLPYSFASFQPGKKVFLHIQFKDDLGNEFNAKPYPIEIRYVASATVPPPTQNTAQCTKGKACGGSDTPCGANGVGQCDACNGGWCKGGACETCALESAANTTRVACDDPSQITDSICGGGVKTYDVCTDDKSQTGAQLCKNGATKFKCVGSKNDYCQSPEYQCSSCPKFAPALTNPACGTTCGGCPLKDTCGNRTYDSCDTTPCLAAGASANTTFKCYAKDSPNNCAGEYLCGSVCAGSAAAPTTTTTAPTTGVSTPGYEPE